MKVLCASIDLFVCEHLYLSLFNHLNLVLSWSTLTVRVPDVHTNLSNSLCGPDMTVLILFHRFTCSRSSSAGGAQR